MPKSEPDIDESDKTPVRTYGSGEFLREQSRRIEEECETLSECPVRDCQGGEIRVMREGPGGRYTMIVETCSFCEGRGFVPPYIALDYELRNPGGSKRAR